MATSDYVLDDQIGFLLRRANQRHLAIFSKSVHDITPTQFAAMAKLHELGATSQNHLGRETAMDAATIKGVIDRLASRGLVVTRADHDDKRRLLIELSESGQNTWSKLAETGKTITQETLDPLSKDEQLRFLKLLTKLI